MNRMFKVLDPKGLTIFVSIIGYGRKGTQSPITRILVHNGKRITPYEQRIRGWKIPLSTIFELTYRDIKIKDLTYNKNPFLTLISKTNDFVGHYVTVPLKLNK